MDCETGLQWLEYYINVGNFDSAYEAAIWAIGQPIKIHIEETSPIEIQRTNSQELSNNPTSSQQSTLNLAMHQQTIGQPGMVSQQTIGRFQPNPGMMYQQTMNSGMTNQQFTNQPRMMPQQFTNQPRMMPQQFTNQTMNSGMTLQQFTNQPRMMPQQFTNQPGMMPQQPIMNPGMDPQQTINQRTTSISTATSNQSLNQVIYEELINDHFYEPTQAVIGATGTNTIQEAEEKIRKFMRTIK